MKKLALAIIFLMMIAVFAACSAGSGDNISAPYPNVDTEEKNSGETSSAYPDSAGGDGKKLIQTAELTLESVEFEDSVSRLETLLSNAGGYIESSEVSGRNGHTLRNARYVVRVPVSGFDGFLTAVGDAGHLLNRSRNAKDVSGEYYDTQSRLEVATMRRDRLLKLIAESTDSTAIVNFENALSDTLYEIDKLTGTIRHYDSLVEFASVSVQLHEVSAYTDEEAPPPKNVPERISRAFSDSTAALGAFFTGLAVFIIGNILYILLIGGVIAAGCVLALRSSKKRKTPAASTED
ncbi:hypothetical protein FACS1894217_00950 [Clostridia bacterium]|nr:hypothetical protein FACS1894217_00950 [Clostridia bacterium]